MQKVQSDNIVTAQLANCYVLTSLAPCRLFLSFQLLPVMLCFCIVNLDSVNTFCFFSVGPQKPWKITITAQGTFNLGINWTLPGGRVDSYVVNISEINRKYSHSNTTQLTVFSFSNLYPGRIHLITVTAIAGNFTNTSDQSYIATGKLNMYM